MTKIPRQPCSSCPYRKDVPSGVWDVSEYVKLLEYDNETQEQPLGRFDCHQQNGCLCRGWLDCHGNQGQGRELLSVRLAVANGSIGSDDLNKALSESPAVKVFGSGKEACLHGLQGIDSPSEEALDVMVKIKKVQAVAETRK